MGTDQRQTELNTVRYIKSDHQPFILLLNLFKLSALSFNSGCISCTRGAKQVLLSVADRKMDEALQLRQKVKKFLKSNFLTG